jgi:hypothetical protein
MREKEGLEGSIKPAIFVAIRWRLKVMNSGLQNDIVSLIIFLIKINKTISFQIKHVVSFKWNNTFLALWV